MPENLLFIRLLQQQGKSSILLFSYHLTTQLLPSGAALVVLLLLLFLTVSNNPCSAIWEKEGIRTWEFLLKILSCLYPGVFISRLCFHTWKAIRLCLHKNSQSVNFGFWGCHITSLTSTQLYPGKESRDSFVYSLKARRFPHYPTFYPSNEDQLCHCISFSTPHFVLFTNELSSTRFYVPGTIHWGKVYHVSKLLRELSVFLERPIYLYKNLWGITKLSKL